MDHNEPPHYILGAEIVRIESGAAWFDIGSKYESPIPLDEWQDEPPPQVGDRFHVAIEEYTELADRVLEIRRVQDGELRVDPCLNAWETIIETLAVGRIREGQVQRKIRDGFLVDIGVNVLLPRQQVPKDYQAEPDRLIGQKISCRVISIDVERRSICVSMN